MKISSLPTFSTKMLKRERKGTNPAPQNARSGLLKVLFGAFFGGCMLLCPIELFLFGTLTHACSLPVAVAVYYLCTERVKSPADAPLSPLLSSSLVLAWLGIMYCIKSADQTLINWSMLVGMAVSSVLFVVNGAPHFNDIQGVVCSGFTTVASAAPALLPPHSIATVLSLMVFSWYALSFAVAAATQQPRKQPEPIGAIASLLGLSKHPSSTEDKKS